MPNGAHLAVDAKVPLSAYLDAQAATDAVDVDRHMARHAAALRAHVNALASKKYWEQNEGPAPEFVVLFVPGESFLADALRSDVSLLQDAMEKRVLLASPVNLLALLWSVARGWQEARIAENARLIADLGEDLYSRMGKVLEHLGKTGRGLDQAVRSYNDLIGSVEGRLLVTLRRFPELGVGTDPLESPSELESLPRSPQVPEVPDTEA
jgi:DNA recombination protein RmuC